MTDIENTVLGIVQDTADYLDEPVLLSSRFMDIGINSVLFIKIIVNVEDTYDLEISEVEIVRLLEENVSSLAQYIQKEVAQKLKAFVYCAVGDVRFKRETPVSVVSLHTSSE